MPEKGIATGLLLALAGLWLILRTVNSDSSGRTLVDRIMGKGADSGSGEATRAPAPAGRTPARRRAPVQGLGGRKEPMHQGRSR